jgi:hypothetical protein
MYKRFTITIAAAALTVTVASASSLAQSPVPTSKHTPISYAHLLAETVAYENTDVQNVAIYTRQNDTAPLMLVAHTSASSEPAPAHALLHLLESGQPVETDSGGKIETMLPLLDTGGSQTGVLSITYSSAAPAQGPSRLDQTISIRDYLRLITPKLETLFDPYMKGYDSTDTLAQRINQILLARHPDVNVIAIHITAPGDTKNKVWGINRPNFIGRDSDEIDTDTEKTGRIVMQVIPATHRMEVHMPLVSPDGRLIGTICTVYLWKSVGEAADFYGRSLSIMEEVRHLTPSNRDDLFRP